MSLRGPGLLPETIAAQEVGFRSPALTPDTYKEDAAAPGPNGSNTVTKSDDVVAGAPAPLLPGQPPNADQVIGRMLERDRELQSSLDGYTGQRRYILENTRHHKRAEMLVRVKCVKNGSKEFDVVSAAGWGIARKHVFPRLLEAETDASRPGLRERSRIIPANYSFQMTGTEVVNGRPAYVIVVTPKTSNKYLMKGRIWVDAGEYAIVRIEGQPAKSPSFWTKSVHFVHTYAKQGPFWFPLSDESVTDVRILGDTDLKIDYFGYLPDERSASLAQPGERRLP